LGKLLKEETKSGILKSVHGDGVTMPTPIPPITFEISGKKSRAIEKFIAQHRRRNCFTSSRKDPRPRIPKRLARQRGAIGGQFTYHLTPTSLGLIVKISCNACEKTKDVTDYDSW
jgi:hypothetical protein